jgi:predicted dehydrogenase
MLNVLIVGCGNIAGKLDQSRSRESPPLTHAGAYSAHAGFRLAACVDSDESRRAHFKTHWNVAADAATIGELDAETGAFDVVSICSPTAAHADHLSEALALRPKVIFCEKPVTESATETELWTRRCAERGVQLAVNYARRWDPDVQKLASELRAGAHGTVRSASATYNKGLLNNGGHLIDLLRMLVGELEVVAAGDAVWDYWPNDPTVSALLRTREGVSVTLNGGHAADFAIFELRLVTERGQIEMLDGGLAWRFRDAAASRVFNGYKTLQRGSIVDGRYPEAMLAAVRNIYDAVASGDRLLCDGGTALVAQSICEKIRRKSISSLA